MVDLSKDVPLDEIDAYVETSGRNKDGMLLVHLPKAEKPKPKAVERREERVRMSRESPLIA